MSGLLFTDETGAQQVFLGDNSGNCDFGNGTPGAPLTMDGVTFRNGSAVLGDAEAHSSSSIKVTGSVSVGASSGASITHSLGRAAFVINGQVQAANGTFVTSNTTTTFGLNNFDSTSAHTVNYVYI